MIPQIILIVLLAIELGIALAQKKDFVSSLIGKVILITILYYGGFFDVILK